MKERKIHKGDGDEFIGSIEKGKGDREIKERERDRGNGPNGEGTERQEETTPTNLVGVVEADVVDLRCLFL